MPTEFRLPALGADMDYGTVVEWHVAPGARVKHGDVVAVVETDKGAIDVEIFDDGVVRDIVVPVGTRVPVGTVLALIETDVAGPAPALAGEGGGEGTGSGTARARVSPAARRRARELGLDVAALRGSGPGGAIVLADVERAAPSPQPAPAAAEEGAQGMRAAIAAAMSRSKREIPHYYLASTLDVTSATAWLAAHNAKVPPA